jgi:hypothetical protein
LTSRLHDLRRITGSFFDPSQLAYANVTRSNRALCRNAQACNVATPRTPKVKKRTLRQQMPYSFSVSYDYIHMLTRHDPHPCWPSPKQRADHLSFQRKMPIRKRHKHCQPEPTMKKRRKKHTQRPLRRGVKSSPSETKRYCYEWTDLRVQSRSVQRVSISEEGVSEMRDEVGGGQWFMTRLL